MNKKNIPRLYAIAQYLNIPTLSLSIIISLQSLTSFASLTPTDDMVIEILLKAGTRPEKRKDRDTALQDTGERIKKNKKDKVTLNTQAGNGHGAMADKDGYTPLHWAAFNGHGAVVEILLTAGVNKDAASKKGWTPLHVAAWNGHIAKPLLIEI